MPECEKCKRPECDEEGVHDRCYNSPFVCHGNCTDTEQLVGRLSSCCNAFVTEYDTGDGTKYKACYECMKPDTDEWGADFAFWWSETWKLTNGNIKVEQVMDVIDNLITERKQAAMQRCLDAVRDLHACGGDKCWICNAIKNSV